MDGFQLSDSTQRLAGEAEARGAPRFTLLLRTAKLIVDDREFLCILRDASATGIKVRLFHTLPEHEVLQLELGNGDRHPLEMVWKTDDHAGFRFVAEVDVRSLIDDTSAAFPKRQLRLRIALPAMIHSGGVATPIAFRDISQQGACIECEKRLLVNELVRIDTDALPAIYAKVRWRSQPRYGVVFEHPFRLDDLARLSAPLQLLGAAAPVRPAAQA